MTAQTSRPNPYVGPRSFQTGERLYGRDREMRETFDLLIANRILLLFSPSGAGKTSLIQAGLFPLLKEEGFRVWPTMRVNLEPPPDVGSGDGFNRYIFSAMISLEEALQEERRLPSNELAGMSLDDYLNHCQFDPDSPELEVLVFDQFEEILTIDPTDQGNKTAFFEQVGEALRNPKRWALFSMREDYAASLDPYLRYIPTRLSNTYRLDRLGVQAALQAITKPPLKHKVTFAPEAASQLIDDLRRVQVQHFDGSVEEQLGPYVEPVQLQVACYRLWEQLPPDKDQIDERDVAEMGDVNMALAGYYADQVAGIAEKFGIKERVIREWFEYQLITERGLRSQVLMDEEKSAGLDNRAIRELERAHLIRAEKRRGYIWFELAHDRLIRPVREDNARWMDENLIVLQRQATLWEREDKPERLLLRGQELADADAWASGHPDELTTNDLDFLEASREAHRQYEMERANAEQRAKLAVQRRLVRFISAIAAVALVMAIAAGIFGRQAIANADLADANRRTAEANESIANAASTEAVMERDAANAARETEAAASRAERQAREEAQKQREIAEASAREAEMQESIARSRELASYAINLIDQRPDLALLLSVEAYRASDTLQARHALLAGLQRRLKRKVVPYGRQIPQQPFEIHSVAFSPDGKRLAWGGADGEVILWDVQEGREIVQPPAGGQEHFATVHGLAFSPDGNLLASVSSDNYIILRNGITGQFISRWYAQNEVHSVSFDRDGARLAAAAGTRVQIWRSDDAGSSPQSGDTTTPEKVMTTHVATVNSLAWSPDGTWLASGDSLGRVNLWNASNDQTSTLPFVRREIKSLAWSPGNNLLAIGAVDGTIVLWDVENNQRSGGELRGPTETLSLAFSADGHILTSGHANGSMILWSVDEGEQIEPLVAHQDGVMSVAFSKGGKTLLASASLDRKVLLHEVITEEPLGKSLDFKVGQVLAISIPDETTIRVTYLEGRQMKVLEAPFEPGEATEIYTMQGQFLGAALSQDGNLLAWVDANGAVQAYEFNSERHLDDLGLVEGSFIALAISQDNQVLAIASCSETDPDSETCQGFSIQAWDLTRNHEPITVMEGDEQLLGMDFTSPSYITIYTGDTIITPSVSFGGSLLSSIRHVSWDSQGITSLAIDVNHDLLVTGHLDQTLILWNAETMQTIGEPLRGSSGTPRALAIHRDGEVLISGGDDGSVYLWDLSIQNWIERACNLAGRNLTVNEENQFFPDGTLERKTCPNFP